jgi:hypothetical protein
MARSSRWSCLALPVACSCSRWSCLALPVSSCGKWTKVRWHSRGPMAPERQRQLGPSVGKDHVHSSFPRCSPCLASRLLSSMPVLSCSCSCNARIPSLSRNLSVEVLRARRMHVISITYMTFCIVQPFASSLALPANRCLAAMEFAMHIEIVVLSISSCQLLLSWAGLALPADNGPPCE